MVHANYYFFSFKLRCILAKVQVEAKTTTREKVKERLASFFPYSILIRFYSIISKMKLSMNIYNSSFFFGLLFYFQYFVGVHSFLFGSQTLKDKIVVHEFFTTNLNGDGNVYKKARNNFSLTSTYGSVPIYKDNNIIGSNKKKSRRNMKIFQMQSLQNSDSTDNDNKGEDSASSSFYFHGEKSNEENDANEMGAPQEEEDGQEDDLRDEEEKSVFQTVALHVVDLKLKATF